MQKWGATPPSVGVHKTEIEGEGTGGREGVVAALPFHLVRQLAPRGFSRQGRVAGRSILRGGEGARRSLSKLRAHAQHLLLENFDKNQS